MDNAMHFMHSIGLDENGEMFVRTLCGRVVREVALAHGWILLTNNVNLVTCGLCHDKERMENEGPDSTPVDMAAIESPVGHRNSTFANLMDLHYGSVDSFYRWMKASNSPLAELMPRQNHVTRQEIKAFLASDHGQSIRDFYEVWLSDAIDRYITALSAQRVPARPTLVPVDADHGPGHEFNQTLEELGIETTVEEHHEQWH